MSLLMVPQLAVKALAENALPTSLTMLGIIIGVGAVICVVAIGEAIGLRQAVGARGRDVLRQFLVEAVMLSLIGRAIGIALGTLGAKTIRGLVSVADARVVGPTVVFVCEHGAAKSVIATAHFNKIAAERGLRATVMFAIGCTLPANATASDKAGNRDDVPDDRGYGPMREAVKRHVEQLVDRLLKQQR